MIKELVHDPIFLSLKSEVATKEDIQVSEDLLDTLTAHKDGCVGMAANMIGERKRIIAFDNEGTYTVMFNPEIIKKSEPYNTEESCLSLLGGPRKCKRYKTIKSPLIVGKPPVEPVVLIFYLKREFFSRFNAISISSSSSYKYGTFTVLFR